ncbi:MAG: hypothetical protein CMJ16_07125 [Peredibacter sp.]|nr:hypothetical protein [Peredibacter sp.]
MKIALLLPFIFFNTYAARTSESFLVTVEDQRIGVIAPKNAVDTATIVVKNKTFDKVISEIKTPDKVLKRFTLFPSGMKDSTFTLTVDFSKAKKVYYAPISPPFQEIPLEFSKGSYEVP